MLKKRINISIDDVSPHPLSSVGVLNRCHELISIYNDIKFTLFIPVSYWRTMGKTATRQALRIDQDEKFCEIISNLSSVNFEIAYHGFFHGIPGLSNNDEFKNMSYNQAVSRIEMMFNVVKDSGLGKVFKPIFRPPAWRMSAEAIRAASDMGIKIFALSPDQYAKDSYGKAAECVNVVYYNACPPFKSLELLNKTEIVYHACEWDKNFLDEKKTSDLNSFLQSCENYSFCFMGDMLGG